VSSLSKIFGIVIAGALVIGGIAALGAAVVAGCSLFFVTSSALTFATGLGAVLGAAAHAFLYGGLVGAAIGGAMGIASAVGEVFAKKSRRSKPGAESAEALEHSKAREKAKNIEQPAPEEPEVTNPLYKEGLGAALYNKGKEKTTEPAYGRG